MFNQFNRPINYWYILSIFFALFSLFVVVFLFFVRENFWIWDLTLILNLSISFTCWFHQTRQLAVRLINLGLFWGFGYLIFQPTNYSPFAMVIDAFLGGILFAFLVIGKLRQEIKSLISTLVLYMASLCFFIPPIFSIILIIFEFIALFFQEINVEIEALQWLRTNLSQSRLPAILLFMAPSLHVILTGKYPSWGFFQKLAQTFSKIM